MRRDRKTDAPRVGRRRNGCRGGTDGDAGRCGRGRPGRALGGPIVARAGHRARARLVGALRSGRRLVSAADVCGRLALLLFGRAPRRLGVPFSQHRGPHVRLCVVAPAGRSLCGADRDARGGIFLRPCSSRRRSPACLRAAADRSPGRIVFGWACLSTACLCPAWCSAFRPRCGWRIRCSWPALALGHYARRGIAGTAPVLAAMLALALTHEGGLVFACAIVVTVALRGWRDAAFLRAAGALVVILAVWWRSRRRCRPGNTMRPSFRRPRCQFHRRARVARERLRHPADRRSPAMAPYVSSCGGSRRRRRRSGRSRSSRWRSPSIGCGSITRSTPRTAITCAPRSFRDPRAGRTCGVARAARGEPARTSIPLDEAACDRACGCCSRRFRGARRRARRRCAADVDPGACGRDRQIRRGLDALRGGGALARHGHGLRSGAGRSALRCRRTGHRRRHRPALVGDDDAILVGAGGAGLAPARLVVDPSALRFWLTCALATAGEKADSPIPIESRRLIRKYSWACIGRDGAGSFLLVFGSARLVVGVLVVVPSALVLA